MDIKVPLPFEICLHDEVMKEPIDYLEGIPKSFLISTAILFLSYESVNSKYDSLNGFLNGFFCSANKPFVRRILSNIIKYEKNKGDRKLEIKKYVVHQKLADLELLKIVFNSSKENGHVSKSNIKEIEIRIFKAYVAINQKLGEKSKHIKPPEIIKKPADIAEFFFLLNLNSFDLNNYRLLKIIITQYYKGCLFLKFLKNCNETKKLIEKFNHFYKVDSIERYLSYLSIIHLKLIENGQITHVDIPDYKIFDFYQKHSLSNISEINLIDYNDIRSKPFVTSLEKDKNRVTVVDSLLTAEMFYNGLYFRLKKINDNLSKGKVDLMRLKTQEFSEKLLFKETISSIFGKRYIQFSCEQIDDSMDGGIDYYVRNGNKVFLFESKDIFLSSESKVSFDIEKVIEEIKTKLYYDESKNKNKAILQLSNFIEKIINFQLPFDKNYKVNSLKIYPIIVVHSRVFNVPGLNVILQDLFKKTIGEKFKNFKGKINELVLIDIDTLIYKREFFESKKINFENLLNEYSKQIIVPAFQVHKIISRKKAEKSITSFSHFFENKIHSLNKKQLTEFIATVAKDVLPEN